jgi:hypothetical protein
VKFKVLRNVSLGIGKTGKITYATKDEMIELEDIAVINDLVMNLAITPADDSLVPESALYKVVHQFNLKFEGETHKGTPGAQLTLKRDLAVFLMSRGYVIPEDPSRWYPGKPSHRVEGQTKKMYDDLNAETENQKGFITSWKEGRQ